MLDNTFTAPENYGLPSTTRGYKITYPKNNESTGYINGFETELQTNLNFLPRPFNGIVLSGNFTLMDSKTDYRYTYIYQIRNPDFPGPGQTYYIWTYVDTFSVDGLLSQAKYLANVSLGYDFKGFSARLSFSYTDDILTREQRRIDALDKEATLAFYRWDFQMKQKITKKLSVYFNIANIFNQPDRAVRLATGYYTRVEYYGLNTNIGIKYNFF